MDHTEKGWFITWIDRDPETIQLQKQLAAKVKAERDDQDREAKFIQKQGLYRLQAILFSRREEGGY